MKDGGPAFPRPDVLTSIDDCWEPGHNGMTLRDWFAGQALAGLLGHELCRPNEATSESTARHIDRVTRAAYGFADAMIAEREKGQ